MFRVRMLYRSFLLRDVAGLFIPGTIVLVAVLLGAEPSVVAAALRGNSVAVLCVWVPLSVLAALASESLFRTLRLTVADHGAGWFGDPFKTLAASRKRTLASHRWVARVMGWPAVSKKPEDWTGRARALLEHYYHVTRRIGPDDSAPLINRLIALKHAAGNASGALVVLLSSQYWVNPRNTDLAWLRLVRDAVCDPMSQLGILAGAILLLAAHYEFAFAQSVAMAAREQVAEEVRRAKEKDAKGEKESLYGPIVTYRDRDDIEDDEG